MTKYTIEIVSEEQLNEYHGGDYAEFTNPRVIYGGKTYTDFVLIEKGSFSGAYQGMAEGGEVIFYEDEIKTAVRQQT